MTKVLSVPASNRLCDQRDSPMNITSPILSPILAGAARVAELPGDSVTSWLKTIGATTGLFDDGHDGGLGLVMSALAGVAAALAEWRSCCRSISAAATAAGGDVIKHGPCRHARARADRLCRLTTSGTRRWPISASIRQNPAVEFEIRLPRAALTAVADTQIELRTDRNQKLAKVQDALASTADGRSVLKGSVSLDYRTTERMVVLNLPGPTQRQFKLRLPASPSPSAQFGPCIWPMALRTAMRPSLETHDAFAIRYRVL